MAKQRLVEKIYQCKEFRLIKRIAYNAITTFRESSKF